MRIIGNQGGETVGGVYSRRGNWGRRGGGAALAGIEIVEVGVEERKGLTQSAQRRNTLRLRSGQAEFTEKRTARGARFIVPLRFEDWLADELEGWMGR